MKLFKRDPFGNIIFIKRIIISIVGALTYSRFMVVNKTKIKGMQHLFDLPNNGILFLSNHQTYYADVIAFYHIFCSVKWRFYNTIMYPVYLLTPRVNMFYVAAEETMTKSGWIPKVFSYAGAVTVKRSWRAAGENTHRDLDTSGQDNIGKALSQGWVVSFPQGTTSPSAPVRKGTAHLIKEHNPLVVPVSINGFRRAFDKKGLFFKKRGTTLSVHFKKPIRFNPDDSVEDIVEQVSRLLVHDPDGFEAKEMK
ncbi:MAG: 1-acyl-sn-glycerol-3-phosphate acyltransferase [Flammeovirgaceae bacterium]|jgi:1-acyl-sn-glycerol-3-phosphate acyltransferase